MRGGAMLAGRYEIGEELGRGGTATVYRAHDLDTGRDVAVKLFTTAPSPASSGRDQREVDILSGLRHPGLVAFREAGTADGQRYVVTDLVDGQSLAQALREGPLPAAAVADLGAEVAEALAYVHERGVVHRDVKPANILLDGDGRPRLADFGIARTEGATRVTHTGVIVGTAAYMAPEQVRGQDVDAAADVYSLGLVLLEALTGRCEYPGTPVEAAVARLHRPPRIPSGPVPGLAPALRRMTAIDPSGRPTAVEAAALLRGLPSTAARRPLVTARRLVPLAAAVLLGGVLGGLALSRAPVDSAASDSGTSTVVEGGLPADAPSASPGAPGPLTGPDPAVAAPVRPAPVPAPDPAPPRAVAVAPAGPSPADAGSTGGPDDSGDEGSGGSSSGSGSSGSSGSGSGSSSGSGGGNSAEGAGKAAEKAAAKAAKAAGRSADKGKGPGGATG